MTTQERKTELLAMAQRGEPRPKKQRHPLSSLLAYCTSPSSTGYDPVLTQQLRKIAPPWFLKSSVVKKATLLQMAQERHPRPFSKKTILGTALVNYTNPSSRCYDEAFTRQIKRISPPDWWMHNQRFVSATRKEYLLNLARSGQPKPRGLHGLQANLRGSLYRYTTPHDPGFDPAFTRQLRKLAPDWLEKPVEVKKATLLKMARHGELPPQRLSPLWNALRNYTRPTGFSYDPDFTRQLKTLAPQWFESRRA
jgi:hypothetical protein